MTTYQKQIEGIGVMTRIMQRYYTGQYCNVSDQMRLLCKNSRLIPQLGDNLAVWIKSVQKSNGKLTQDQVKTGIERLYAFYGPVSVTIGVMEKSDKASVIYLARYLYSCFKDTTTDFIALLRPMIPKNLVDKFAVISSFCTDSRFQLLNQ